MTTNVLFYFIFRQIKWHSNIAGMILLIYMCYSIRYQQNEITQENVSHIEEFWRIDKNDLCQIGYLNTLFILY